MKINFMSLNTKWPNLLQIKIDTSDSNKIDELS
jgi:hypothetical protein